MFEVGKSYSFAFDDQDGFGTASYKVIAWEAPLLTLASVNQTGFVLNTASLRFHSAKPLEFDASAPISISIDFLGDDGLGETTNVRLAIRSGADG